MVIEEISIKGFKSFGNSEQVLKLNTEKGELILLYGQNGAGKSALLESVEFTLYGKVKSGKSKKWTKLGLLPNRINGELLNKIKFKSGNNIIEVERGISPNILKLTENGIEFDRAGKSNVDERISKYVGIDIETFKSFISLSINDFKNFIQLSSEEKQLLLDKLFNLEVINILNGILKDLNKNNKLYLSKIDSEINTLKDSIDSIRNSIQKAIEKEKEDLQLEIDDIKQKMESKKEDYTTLKDKLEKIKLKEKELKDSIDKEREQIINIDAEIRTIQREIDLYDSGKCPTCKRDFDDEHFHNLRWDLLEKKKVLETTKSQFSENINLFRERGFKLQKMSEETTSSFNDITYLLKNYKSQIDQLLFKKEKQSGQSSNLIEFEKTMEELEIRKNNSEIKSDELKEREIFYKELSKVFSEDGVKKTIISSIVRPINFFLQENIKKMGLNFQVSIDESFNAEIKHLGDTIEQDSLSTGENKRINICIMIAYLKMIRTKKHINILFLDEVFSSIDIEGVDNILKLLKDFANNYRINIFVVHHAIMNQENFDRVLKMNKEVFTSFEEVEMNYV